MSHYWDEIGPDLPPEAGDLDEPRFDPRDDWIKNAARPLQIEAMRRWFLGRYEDPANRTPYDSSEGGYQFIWGGPYDPDVVIKERFGYVVPDEAMDELIHDLRINVGSQWAPVVSETEYDSALALVVFTRDDPYLFLTKRLGQIDAVIKLEGSVEARQLLLQMSHSSIIAALEAYLADTALFWVLNEPHALRSFVSKTKDFQVRTVLLSNIFDRMDNLANEVEKFLQEIVWHRLDKVKPMLELGNL